MAKKKRKSTTILSRNGNTWTEAEFFSRIRSSLRRVFRYWIPMQAALKLASRPNESTNKRLKTEYQCNQCKNWFKRDNVHIDHKIDCGSLNNYDDIAPFIQRLTSEDVDSYQVLCKPCHSIKSKEARKKNKL